MAELKAPWKFDPWTGKVIPVRTKRTDPWVFDPWTGSRYPERIRNQGPWLFDPSSGLPITRKKTVMPTSRSA